MKTKGRRCGARKRVPDMAVYHICARDPHHVGQHKCGLDGDVGPCGHKWPRK